MYFYMINQHPFALQKPIEPLRFFNCPRPCLLKLLLNPMVLMLSNQSKCLSWKLRSMQLIATLLNGGGGGGEGAERERWVLLSKGKNKNERDPYITVLMNVNNRIAPVELIFRMRFKSLLVIWRNEIFSSRRNKSLQFDRFPVYTKLHHELMVT